MTDDAVPALTPDALAALSGRLARHGRVWHAHVRPDELLTTVGEALSLPSAALVLACGEDRKSANEIWAHYLVGSAGHLVHVSAALPRDRPMVPTLAGKSFPASRFEREMRDLVGIEPVGHPDPRPLVRHGFWPETFFPLREDAVTPDFADDGKPFPFTEVAGAGIYEIPVGPVHAGVIEPGHFRFSVLGETIVKMRARLYFTHKGTERLFAGRTPDEGVTLAERVSGDTSVGHALAYCEAIEACAGTGAPLRARYWRTVLLELERLYNHVGDAGAIIGDTGFQVGQTQCLRIRELLLRLNRRVAGHRLLRGAIVPGGVAIRDDSARGLVDELKRIGADFDEVMQICSENTLVRDRLDRTGRLSPQVAVDFGVVGFVARACGLTGDVRADFPFAGYDALGVSPVVEQGGDVAARLLVRVREFGQSVDLIDRALSFAAPAETRAPVGPLRPFAPAFGLVEAWRGRLVHMIIAAPSGRLHRVKIVDPSFFNWPALARALEDNIVPDFPLCNKSFNQSYSGNDL